MGLFQSWAGSSFKISHFQLDSRGSCKIESSSKTSLRGKGLGRAKPRKHRTSTNSKISSSRRPLGSKILNPFKSNSNSSWTNNYWWNWSRSLRTMSDSCIWEDSKKNLRRKISAGRSVVRIHSTSSNYWCLIWSLRTRIMLISKPC